MSEDASIRRANLRRLCRARSWKPSDLSERIGSRLSYWRDMVADDKKSFGEKAARRIDDSLSLPRGWLDQPDAEIPAATHVAKDNGGAYSTRLVWPFAADLHAAVLKLPATERARVELVIRALVLGRPDATPR